VNFRGLTSGAGPAPSAHISIHRLLNGKGSLKQGDEMTTQVIEVGGGPVIVSRALRRPRAAVDWSLSDLIRCTVAVILLVLALCGMAATASFAGAGATPPEGPAPGLGL
jgi:hypothetical protein